MLTLYSREINFLEKIAPNFDDLLYDVMEHNHTHYMLKGGRGSTKSSFVSKVIPLLIMANSDCHAVIVRKVGQTLKGSVYNQMIWSINDLGLNGYFKVYKSPLKIVYTPTNQEIVFLGCDDPMKAKGITVPFGRIGIVWYEELDQFNGMEEIRSMTQSFIRKNGDNWVFYTFNPPKSKNNWVNEEQLIDREDRLIHHSTYLTVPSDWLGQQFIIEAEHLKNVKEEAYKHEYLGEVTGTGGNVFDNVIIREITKEEINNMEEFEYGVDFGFSIDPATWCKIHYKNNKLYIIDEIYEQGLSNKKLTDKILEKEPNIYKKPIVADSADPKSISEMRGYGLNMQKAKKGPDSRDFTYKFLQMLDEIVIDKKRTPNAAKEFIGYEYEMNKDGQFISKYPDGNDHYIDAVRYAIMDIARRKQKRSFSANRIF